jgi:2-polyprenyl-6-methoxyphenol hydroxylase-like FAD-dependent oxidoreductase
MSDPSIQPFDVVVVGAGLAGVTTAHVLGRAGYRVALVDPREECAPCFKAEKVEPDQADLLRKLGLLDTVAPLGSRIQEVLCARGDRALEMVRLEQYGVFYHDMVNGVQRALPKGVVRRVARVDDIALGPDLQRVTCHDGVELRTRLVVLSSGTSARLAARLGLRRRMLSERHSLALGFDVEPLDGRARFDSITYFCDDVAGRFDYITLFPIGSVLRGNVFMYRTIDDPMVRRLYREPRRLFTECFPGLARFSGELRVSSKVEACPIDLYTTEGYEQPGMVLVGDAFQSVCPATGTGLSKVLTDVDILTSELVPAWLATPGMDTDKTLAFYSHPRKTTNDVLSARRAVYRRRVSTETSLSWRLRRERSYLQMRLSGWRARWEDLVRRAGLVAAARG